MIDHIDSSQRILIVEDDSDQRQVYATLLYYNGYDVDEAETFSEAMKIIEYHKPDAVLMDVVLPDTNGLAATSLMKTLPSTSDIPVICMTAYDVEYDEAAAGGCFALLKKPFDGSVLVPMIRRALHHS